VSRDSHNVRRGDVSGVRRNGRLRRGEGGQGHYVCSRRGSMMSSGTARHDGSQEVEAGT
jgi:hypothetical protein